jgi:hypothetical protein
MTRRVASIKAFAAKLTQAVVKSQGISLIRSDDRCDLIEQNVGVDGFFCALDES